MADAIRNIKGQSLLNVARALTRGGGEYIQLMGSRGLDVVLESPDVATIHLMSLGNLGHKEKLLVLFEGMAKMAERLRLDPKMKNVETIAAVSWVVTKKPHILEGLGFTPVAEDRDPLAKKLVRKYALNNLILRVLPKQISKQFSSDLKTRPAFAFITREDFLNRYGNDRKGAATVV